MCPIAPNLIFTLLNDCFPQTSAEGNASKPLWDFCQISYLVLLEVSYVLVNEMSHCREQYFALGFQLMKERNVGGGRKVPYAHVF